MDLNEKNKLNAKIKMQIQDEIKKALKSDSISDSRSNIGEIEVRNISKLKDIIRNKGLIFSFVTL